TGHHGRRYTVWYRFGSGQLPQRTSSLGTVLGRRAVEGGELILLAADHRKIPPRVWLQRNRDDCDDAVSSWWRKMFDRRAYTPAEFFEADRRMVLPGPFRD